MAQKSNFSKLAQFRSEERMRAAQGNPGLLSGLTPTQMAELFPDYFKRGTPDAGGFYAAISKESARKQGLWQGSVDTRLDRQGGMLSRMRQEYSGTGNYGSTAASGNLKQNQQEAYKAARAEGLSDSAARILVANMSGESLKNPGDHHWDVKHMSQGIVQWDPTRAERIKNHFGAYPKDMSVAQQTKAAIWEMKTYYGTSYNALTNDNLSPSQRMHTVVADYERPQDVGGSVANRMGFYNGLNVTDDSGKGGTPQQGKGGATPGQGGTATTPGAPGADTTKQAGQRTEGASFNVVSGYIVPKDNSLYDTRNAQQCATLGKAFNPAIGRSSGWTIVDGDIKAGQVVATKQYNNGGADRVGAGYHTGVALTAPNEKGDFLLLEQYNGSGGAKTRWVNKDSYPAGHGGGTTSWGLISSGGKVHTEISQEALSYGQQIASPEHKKAVGTNSGSPGTGGETAPGVEGNIEYAGSPQGPMGGATVGEGEQQSASLMQPVAMMQNLMGMMGGMMGGQSASPLGLITSAMGFIMPLIGSIAGERLTGEGMGDATRLPKINVAGHLRGHKRHGPAGGHAAPSWTPNATSTGYKENSNLVNYESKHLAPALGISQQQYAAYREAMVSIESQGGKYNLRGGSSNRFSGAYQMGHEALAISSKILGEKSPVEKRSVSGTGKQAGRMVSRIVATDDYINTPAMQEKHFDAWMLGLHQEMMGNKKYAAMPAEKKLEVLGFAHNSGGPAAKRWLNTGAVARDANNFDTTKYAQRVGRNLAALKEQGESATQVAAATPAQTTGQVGPNPPTPDAPASSTTQMAQQETSVFEKGKKFIFGSTGSEAKESVTPSVSMDIGAVRAPTVPFSKEARNAEGIYSNPSRSDMMTQFGYKKQLDSATIAPQTNVPAAPASPTTVTPTRGAMMQAPGPAPDVATAALRNQINTTVATTTQNREGDSLPSQRQQSEPISQTVVHNDIIKTQAQPYDNPSFHRAVSRAYGSETHGEIGQNHFNNGDTSFG